MFCPLESICYKCVVNYFVSLCSCPLRPSPMTTVSGPWTSRKRTSLRVSFCFTCFNPSSSLPSLCSSSSCTFSRPHSVAKCYRTLQVEMPQIESTLFLVLHDGLQMPIFSMQHISISMFQNGASC